MSVRQPGPRHRRAVAASLLGLLAACSSWQVQPVAPAELLSRSSPSQVRLQLHDGRRMVLRQPVLRADSLVGGTAADGTAVAVADIDSVALWKRDPAKTIGLTVLIIGVPAILCAATCQFGPDFGTGFSLQ